MISSFRSENKISGTGNLNCFNCFMISTCNPRSYSGNTWKPVGFILKTISSSMFFPEILQEKVSFERILIEKMDRRSSRPEPKAPQNSPHHSEDAGYIPPIPHLTRNKTISRKFLEHEEKNAHLDCNDQKRILRGKLSLSLSINSFTFLHPIIQPQVVTSFASS